MNPRLVETNIKVIFYIQRNKRHLRTRVYQFVSCQKIAHAVILFTQGDKKYIYVINPKGGMYLVEEEKYAWILKREGLEITQKVVDLGSAPVSLFQLSCFVDRPKFKLAPMRENIFWWFIGRFLSKTYQPMTCALAMSYLLRICGFKVGLHIAPHTLYKEIRNGIDNHFWTSKGWQEYSS